MVQDQDFFPSYNYSYAYFMCQLYLSLTTQEPIVGKSYNVSQHKDASHLQQQSDCFFMNHQVEEHCYVNQDSISHKTRSKRRVIEDITPPPNEASTSNIVCHIQVLNDQSNVSQ